MVLCMYYTAILRLASFLMFQLATYNFSLIDAPVVVGIITFAIADCSPGSVDAYFYSSLRGYNTTNKSYITIIAIAQRHT